MLGNETRTARDGLQAVEQAGEFLPHVVLMDIGMPGLNGYDAVRRIRRLPWGGRVTLVALTDWGSEDDKRKARQAGFDHHFVKPVEPSDLQRFLSGLTAGPD
jgi:CheY-like chemotaxis protein